MRCSNQLAKPASNGSIETERAFTAPTERRRSCACPSQQQVRPKSKSPAGHMPLGSRLPARCSRKCRLLRCPFAPGLCSGDNTASDQRFQQRQPGPSSLARSSGLDGASFTMSSKSAPRPLPNLRRIGFRWRASPRPSRSSPWTSSVTAFASALCAARASGFSLVLLLEGLDLRAVKKGKVLQIPNHVTVIGSNPELVKPVDAGPAVIQPHCPLFRFAELGAIGISDQRQRHPKTAAPSFLRVSSIPAVILPH